VTPPRQAVSAASADYVPFTRDNLARAKIIYIGANIDNLSNKFMANYHRYGDGGLGPTIPVVDMHIGATDCSAVYFDEDIIDAYFWLRHIF
jgi:hypothetical protein